MEIRRFEGMGTVPLSKPRLNRRAENRNRPIRAVGMIVLSPESGDIVHVINPDAQGFVIDHPEDFSLHRLDIASLKEYKCEKDEIIVVFGMHVIAKIPLESIDFLRTGDHASA